MTSDFNFQKAREAWGDRVVAPTHRVFQEWLNNPLTKALKQSHKTETENLGARVEKLEAMLAEAVWNYGELKRKAEMQEPVAFRNTETGEFCTGGFLRKDLAKWQPLYAAPREWVGLTDDEEDEIAEDWGRDRLPDIHSVTKAIEAKLKEKNT